jgi:uncharacterized membrane protein
MKSIVILFAVLLMVNSFESEEKHYSKAQKKVMEMAAKEADKNKNKSMRLMKSSVNAKKK